MKILFQIQPKGLKIFHYGLWIVLSTFCFSSFATNYTWTGSTSKDWSTTTNWSPSGVPGSGDNVTIGSGTDTINLSGNITIANLTLSGRKLNLSGYTLTLTGTSTLSAGKAYNGKLVFTGAQVAFSGSADISAKVSINSPKPLFNGGSFSDSVSVISVLSSASSLSTGGSTFNGPLAVSVSGGVYTFRMESTSRNIYNAPVSFTAGGKITFQFSNTSGTNTVFSDTLRLIAKDTAYIQQNGASGTTTTFSKKVFISSQDTAQVIIGVYSGQTTTFNDVLDISTSSKRRVYLAHSGELVFNKDVYLSCTGNGLGVYYGYNSSASSSQSIGSIKVGSGGFSVGRLDLFRYIKTSSDSLALTFTGSAKLIFGVNNTLSGPVRVLCPMVYLNGTTFNSYARIDQNGTTNTSSTGGNTFNGEAIIGEYGTGQFQLCTSSSATDNFNGAAIFKNYASYDFADAGNLVISKDGTTNFSGSKAEIFLNTPARIIFGYNNGSVVNMGTTLELNSVSDGWVYLGGRASKFNLGSGKTIKVGSSGFTGGRVSFFNVEQIDTTSINLTFTGNSSRLSFSKQAYSPFGTTKLKGKLNFTGPVIDMEEGDFYGDVSISITSGANTNSYSNGGNDFYANLTIVNNSSYNARLAYLKGDVYHKNISLSKIGSGNIQTAYVGESIFKGDIYSTGGILFGTNGGWVKLDNTGNQTIDYLSGGSGAPSFKKLKIDKSGGQVFVNLNCIVTDSLILNNGVVKMGSSNYLDLKSGLVVTSASDASFVDGLVRKTGNSAFSFPIGSEDKYFPLSISAPSSSSDAFTARYYLNNANALYSFASKDGTLNNLDDKGYWTLDRNTGSSTPNVTLSFGTPYCGATSPTNMKVGNWNGSQWKDRGRSSSTSTTITVNTQSNFGPFVLSNLIYFESSDAGLDLSLCKNSSIELNGSGSGYNSITYSWSPSLGLSSTSIPNPIASLIATTEYTLTVTDESGCKAFDDILVTVNENPTADAGPDYTICPLGSIAIGAPNESGFSYSWTPSTFIDDVSISSPKVNPNESTEYVVIKTDDLTSCSDTDTVQITVNSVLLADCGNPPVDSYDAQTEYESDLDSTFKSTSLFSNIFDRFGNQLNLKEIMINDTIRNWGHNKRENGSQVIPKSIPAGCSSGYYQLWLEEGSGVELFATNALHAARLDVLCQVFSDLSSFIPSGLTSNGEKINVWIRNISNVVTNPSIINSVLGAASAYYVVPPSNGSVNGIIDTEVWKSILSGHDSYQNVFPPLTTFGFDPSSTGGSVFHGYMAFNFLENSPGVPNYDWQTDLSNLPSTSQEDLYTVTLHEATHFLGFASLIGGDCNSKFGTNFNYYSRYDQFLYTNAGLDPLIVSSGCNSLYDIDCNLSNPTAILGSTNSGCSIVDHTNCPATAVFWDGTINQQLFTPQCYFGPSTLSHFEDECQVEPGQTIGNNEYYVMSNANGPYAKRYLKQYERQVLCDLGYQVLDDYGNSSDLSNHHYSGGPCTGDGIYGLNDGITSTGSYSYITTVNTGVSIPSPLANDDPSADNWECLQIILGTGSATSDNGNSSTGFTYLPTSAGLHLLRYVPLNSTTGKRGNITYIYVFVKSLSCDPSLCNVIANGDFESVSPGTSSSCGFISPYGNFQIDCWNTFEYATPANTPDLFTDGCTSTPPVFDIGTVTQYSNPPADIWNPTSTDNEYFIGMHASTYPNPYNNNATSFLRHAEAMYVQLASPLIPNTDYILKFKGLVNDELTNPAQTPITNISPSVKLFFGGFDQPFAVHPFNVAPPLETAFSSQITQLVPSSSVEVTYHDDLWQFFNVPFTYTGTSNSNFILAAIDIFSYSGSSEFPIHHYVFLDSLEIIPVYLEPTMDLPLSICAGETVNVTGSPGSGTFTGVGMSLSGATWTFDATVAGVGIHQITYEYTDGGGCKHSVTQYISVVDNTMAQAGPDIDRCANDDGVIIGTVVPGVVYSWSPSSGLSCTDCAQPIATPFATTTYTLTITVGANECSYTDDVTVTVLPTPTVSVGSDLATCQNQTLGLTATPSGGTSPYVYSWSPSADLSSSIIQNPIYAPQSPLGVPIESITLTVELTDANGCKASDDIQVEVYPPLEAMVDYGSSDLCGLSGTATATINVTSGTSPFTYLWDDPSSQTTATATGLSSGIGYNATVTDNIGCTLNLPVAFSCVDFLYYDCHSFLDCSVFDDFAGVNNVSFLVQVTNIEAGIPANGNGFWLNPQYSNIIYPNDPLNPLICSGGQWWDLDASSLGLLNNHINLTENHGLIENTYFSGIQNFFSNSPGNIYKYQLFVSYLANPSFPNDFSPYGTSDIIDYYGCTAPETKLEEDVKNDTLISNLIDHNFYLYPNPSNGDLRIVCNDEIILDKIIFYNIEGQKLGEFMNVDCGSELEVSNFENGLYFYKIINNGINLFNDKLIILKK